MANLTEQQKAAMIPELYRQPHEAAHCRFLHFGPLVRTTETLRPIPVMPRNSPLLMPHELPSPTGSKLMPVTLWPDFPTVSFTCTSPEMVDWARRIMPAEVSRAVNSLETNLGACTCCAFWQKRDEQ